jgi:hypothetical protein
MIVSTAVKVPRRFVLSLLVNGAAPVIGYLLLRGPLHSDVAALSAGLAAPVCWSLALAAWKRTADPIAVVSLAGLGIAVAVSLATGGGTLPLLLRHVAVTGTAGLACLGSVLAGRPLLQLGRPLLLRLAPRPIDDHEPSTVERLRIDGKRYFTVLTAIVGAVLIAHAAANVALALTLSTTRYLVVSRPVGWTITALGAVFVITYMKRARRG